MEAVVGASESSRAAAGRRGDPFAAAIRASQMAMIVTDPHRLDNPIVYANDAFLRLTGYARLDVVGRNCRLLQGAQTDARAIGRIREAIGDRADITIDILNYRRDGSSFHNALTVGPVRDEAGDVRYFFASQVDVSDRYQVLRERDQANARLADALMAQTLLVREIDHRVKNNLQMVTSMIVLQCRAMPDPEIRRSLMATLERVDALSMIHHRLSQASDVTRFEVGECLRDLVGNLLGAAGRADVRVRFDLVPVVIPADRSAALALLLNEIITNALKHGLPDGRPGTLSVSLGLDPEGIRICIADDGVGMSPEAMRADAASREAVPSGAGAPDGTFGRTMIRTLGLQLGARLHWRAGPVAGTSVEIRLPMSLAVL
ncbi:histidine kinase dimerization/phosphoacceptor domain -containing protein [Methylobacterium sp. A54F]